MKTLAFLLLIAAAPSHAALLVYEGYNGYSTAATMGAGTNTNPNSNTIGLNTSVPYGGTGLTNYSYTNTGITFGSLPVSGGAITFNRPTAGTAIISGEMNFATTVAVGGTVWTSYLINISAAQGAIGDGFHSRIATGTGTSGVHFQTFPDNRGNAATTEASVRYVDTTTLSGASLTTGVDYFILGSFTNVGAPLSAGSPGIATMYAFNLTQFESLMAAADRNAYLASVAQGAGAAQATIKVSQSATSTTQTFVAGQSTHFVTVGMSGTVDELRWGTDLASVIPEPSALLFSLAGFGLFTRRKR